MPSSYIKSTHETLALSKVKWNSLIIRQQKTPSEAAIGIISVYTFWQEVFLLSSKLTQFCQIKSIVLT